jgi:hypothetical protein
VVILILQISKATAVGSVTSVTGCNLTWTFIGSRGFDTLAAPAQRLEAWWGVGGSPSSGTTNLTKRDRNELLLVHFSYRCDTACRSWPTASSRTGLTPLVWQRSVTPTLSPGE